MLFVGVIERRKRVGNYGFLRSENETADVDQRGRGASQRQERRTQSVSQRIAHVRFAQTFAKRYFTLKFFLKFFF